jgi:hypothetical protein
MKNTIIVLLLALGLLTSAKQSFAYDVVLVPMDQLLWQITPDGKVYLRNLNSFNSAFSGCCYNYWVDTTTPAGKSLWAVMLMKISTAQSMDFLVGSAAAGGQVEYAGNW